VCAGLADVVVMFYGKSEASRQGRPVHPCDRYVPRVYDGVSLKRGAYMSTWNALWAQLYMHEFGVKRGDLAEVAVFTSTHATPNPGS